MSSGTEPHSLHWCHLGRISFSDALHVQRFLWHQLQDRAPADTVLTLEHEPVVTLGRRANESDLLLSAAELSRRGIDVERADRGGEVTYHGPGQLVVYVNALLERFRVGPADIVRMLAGAIADELASVGIDAEYDKNHPGLWVGGRKIAAVGMRISRGASLHGAAVNLTTNLDAFSLFVPCGMPGAQATSVAEELQRDGERNTVTPSLEAMGRAVAERLATRLGSRIDKVESTELRARSLAWTPPGAS
jgi:lipoate-protein ligase B